MLHMIAEDAAVIGIANCPGSATVLPCHRNQRFKPGIDGRVGETAAGVDDDGRGRCAPDLGHGVADNFSALYVLAVDRHVHQTVAPDAILFRGTHRTRE